MDAKRYHYKAAWTVALGSHSAKIIGLPSYR
jgi:hypothetical protein